MKWYDTAVFYHIYPLGLCGCKKENNGEKQQHFDKLTQWSDHAAELGFTAIYIGPLFESEGHGYETRDYKQVDCRLGTNDDFKKYVAHCHEKGMHIIVDGVFNHVGRTFPAFQDLLKNRENSAYKDWFCNVNFGGNNEYNDGLSYENWGGYNLLVKLNQRNPEVKSYLFEAIKFWIDEFDIESLILHQRRIRQEQRVHRFQIQIAAQVNKVLHQPDRHQRQSLILTVLRVMLTAA